MSKYEVKVESVEGNHVNGTCDGIAFEAAPFRWGSKMLMKVVADDTRSQFSQGQKVAIGAAAKKALRTAEIPLPVAELVRPRKPKAEAIVEAAPTVDEAESDVSEAEAEAEASVE
jgi:hypothetical protein